MSMDPELARLIETNPGNTVPCSSHGKEKTIGVYVIKHEGTGNMYVGSAADLYKREREHFGTLASGTHRNPELQKAFHSDSRISFHSLPTESREEAYNKEQQLINVLSQEGRIFNVGKDVRSPWKGQTLSSEHRERLSQAHRGVPLSAAHRAAQSAAHMGKSISSETAKKIATANTGRVMPEETKAKISAKLSGRTLAPEHAEAIRKANTGRVYSPEALANRINNGIRRKISIDGVIYDSIQAAATKLGLGKSTVHARVNNPSESFNQWKYTEDTNA